MTDPIAEVRAKLMEHSVRGMAKRSGQECRTIQRIRDGEDCKVSTLHQVVNALGGRIKIEWEGT